MRAGIGESRRRLSLGAALCMVITALAFGVDVRHASADTIFTVTSAADSAPGEPVPDESLRAAVEFARVVSGPTTIRFDLPAGIDTIDLQHSLPAFNRAATIDGPGSGELTINIADRRIFFSRHDLAVSGVTLTGGAAQDGGAIWSGDDDDGIGLDGPSHLAIDDVVFASNRALVSGGAIYKEGGSATITNSRFVGNETSNTGSALFAGPVTEPSNITVVNSVFMANETTTQKTGAAIDHRAGLLEIENSRIENNVGYSGSGLRLTGTTSIYKTTISGNQSFSGGGGIANFGDLSLDAVEVHGNVASNDPAAEQVRHRGQSLTIEHSTLQGAGPGSSVLSAGETFRAIRLTNSTVTNGSVDLTESFGGPVVIAHSTFVDAPINVATSTSAPDFELPVVDIDHTVLAGLDVVVEPLATGVVRTVSSSLIEDTTAIDFTNGSNNVENVASFLEPLRRNGGFTRTYLPSAGSPLINAGTATVGTAPAEDQRGEQRLLDGAIDIGSVEIGTYGPQEFIVTSTEDAGVGTFRSAIFASEATPGVDTITFDLAAGDSRIELESSLKEISDAVVIVGPGADLLEVAIDDDRILYTEADLAISGMTFTGGGAIRGGAIWADNADLTIDDMSFVGNISLEAGAAVAADGANLTITNSEFRENSTFRHGSAIVAGNESRPTRVSIDNSTFRLNNTAAEQPGVAVDVVNGELVLTNSVVANNAGARDGSGVRTGGASLITNTTIIENGSELGANGITSFGPLVLDGVRLSPSSSGGDESSDTIRHTGGILEIRNTTVTGNGAFGGAVAVLDADDSVVVVNSTFVDADLELPERFLGTARIAHSTFVDSLPASDASPLGVDSSLASVDIDHSIFASSAGSRPGPKVGSVTNSLIQFASLLEPAQSSNNVVDDDPLLGRLSDNGGPTPTMLPAFNSPVINAGAVGFAGVVTDQRGNDRVQRGRIDIGAVETDADRFAPRIFNAIEPSRFADSRRSGVTIDGAEVGWGPATLRSIAIAGRGEVPATATGIVVNVTAIRPQGDGFVSLLPCDVGDPTTASLNFRAGVTISSEILAPLGRDGFVCMVSSVPTDLVLDVVGYIDELSGLKVSVPRRLEDTRAGADVDLPGRSASSRVSAGNTLTFAVAGRGPVPVDASAVVVNVTAVRPGARGFVTSHPCLDEVPLTASLNFDVGVNRGNELVVATDDDGFACVTVSAETDVTVDLIGWIDDDAEYTDVGPDRLIDTRPGGQTVDGEESGAGRVGAGQEIVLAVAGRGDIAGDATLATVNVTAVNPADIGFLTFRRCDIATPLAASLTYEAGSTAGNEILTEISADGTICVFSSAETHLTVDISGFG